MNQGRGKPEQYTDQKLKELAFEVKHNKLKGGKLSYLLLEKHTGISRNTFKRRINDYIAELNKPIIRKVELSERDEVYFPNIDVLFEKYQNDKSLLKDALHEIEMLFFEVYRELETSRQKLEELMKVNETVKILEKEVEAQKTKASYYESLYKNVVVSSTFPEKRNELNINKPLILFENNNENTDIVNLKNNFDEIKKSVENRKEHNDKKVPKTNKLKQRFGNIFNEE